MIQDIKIFAADIDGTLALKGDNLMPKTKEALERLHQEGVLIGVASGRPLDNTVLNMAKKWGLDFEFDYAIGMNGGDLWTKETRTINRYYYLQPNTIKQILSFVWDLDVNAIIYKDAYAYIKAKRMDNFLIESQKRNHSYIEIGDIDFCSEDATGKIELQLSKKEIPMLMKRIEENQSDDWIWVKTFELDDHVSIEFQDPRVHKGMALEKYAEMMGIPMEKTIAFGDMQNDYGLIQSAGWGVCLLNGCSECKEVAQAITEYPVTEDGVGNYLETNWFNK
ncbi:MAG: Cof-type HAD-IIB family hydrolase [Bacillota bacterium]|nr:Cof-type HAD-IIB family hydrolase [Bacillota bacterium]